MASQRENMILLGIGVVAALTLLYSVLIAQQILVWFVIVIQLFVIYLVWRFVRAHERIAGALETPSRNGETNSTDRTRER